MKHILTNFNWPIKRTNKKHWCHTFLKYVHETLRKSTLTVSVQAENRQLHMLLQCWFATTRFRHYARYCYTVSMTDLIDYSSILLDFPIARMAQRLWTGNVKRCDISHLLHISKSSSQPLPPGIHWLRVIQYTLRRQIFIFHYIDLIRRSNIENDFHTL